MSPERGYTGEPTEISSGYGDVISARAWSFVDGKAWFEVRAAGMGLTVVGNAEDVRRFAAELVKAADASEKAAASVSS